MTPDRPPETDAEFRVVRGAWPRWAMHLSLIKLVLYSAGVSALFIVAALIVAAVMGLFD